MSFKIERISREKVFAQLIDIWAQRGTCPRARIGAIITRNNRVIASGYNGAPSGMRHCEDVGCDLIIDEEEEQRCVRAVHAEAAVISFCAREGISLQNAQLWCTYSPCIECAKLIINAGILKLHFEETYRNLRGLQLLRDANYVASSLSEGTFTSLGRI